MRLSSKYLCKPLLFIFVCLLFIGMPLQLHASTPVKYWGLPTVTLKLSNLDDTGNLIYIGVDLAVFYEIDAPPGSPDDTDGDGKVFKVKDGKVKRFLMRSVNITVNLGSPSEYERGVKHKLAMRTLYTPTGTNPGDIIIASQSNGKDGWIDLPETMFMLTFLEAPDGSNPYIKHTEKWEANRSRYNTSKVFAGLAAFGTDVRPENLFWSGEKLIVEVPAHTTLTGIRVTIRDGANHLYTKTINTYVSNGTTDGGVIYKGWIYEPAMFNKHGNWSSKTLDVDVTAILAGVDVETQTTSIIFDNKDQFYRIKKVY